MAATCAFGPNLRTSVSSHEAWSVDSALHERSAGVDVRRQWDRHDRIFANEEFGSSERPCRVVRMSSTGGGVGCNIQYPELSTVIVQRLSSSPSL